MNRKILNLTILFSVLFAALATNVYAAQDDWRKRTVMTVNHPIEISGKIIPPGKYIFEIVSLQAERNVVRVTSQEDDKIYATVIAIPDFRLEPKDKTSLYFYEPAVKGAPEPLRAWFYPGHTIGVEFVYPKKRAIEIAAVTKEHVIANATEAKPVETPVPAEELIKAPLVAITPEGTELPVAEVHPPVPEPAPIPEIAKEPAETALTPEQVLPKTASPYPLVGLLGFAAAAGAIAARLLRR